MLFALSGQLNELGFMGYAGQRLAAYLGGLSWPVTYVSLIVIYVAIHYMFVSRRRSWHYSGRFSLLASEGAYPLRSWHSRCFSPVVTSR